MASENRGVELLNRLSAEEARETFFRCCGSRRWAEMLAKRRPFASLDDLLSTAINIWRDLPEADWLEAFSQHPKIGDRKAVEKKPEAERRWSAGEQAGVEREPEEVQNELAQKNVEYERRFGFIFIVCATGKSGSEMLRMLKDRLGNKREIEIRIAAEEQAKITRLRLEKLLAESSPTP